MRSECEDELGVGAAVGITEDKRTSVFLWGKIIQSALDYTEVG